MAPGDCYEAAKDVSIVYHLAAGTGTKSYPEAFRNSVVTTRNLLDAVVKHRSLKRFVNTSSFAVYKNQSSRGNLDESCPVEENPELRGEAYTYAKAKQDELVTEYCTKFQIPFVTVPGMVCGPSKPGITSGKNRNARIRFLFSSGRRQYDIPLTYRDNCAEAILAAGSAQEINEEIFNIVDDELPSSRKFLQLYKKYVEPVRSIYIPRWILYLGCLAWEQYCRWSDDQLPPIFNRRTYRAYWEGTTYSNAKLKRLTGWKPMVPTEGRTSAFF